MSQATFTLQQIGTIHSPLKEPAGAVIQSAFADDIEGFVQMREQYAQGLADLDGFERIWLIYYFDRCKDFNLTVKPYMDDHQRGLFATRAPARPNPIGISPVKLLAVEKNRLRISGVDILDGTPLLDIKPYNPKFDCFEVHRTGWLGQTQSKNHRADDRFHK